jgi:hypothetical protein
LIEPLLVNHIDMNVRNNPGMHLGSVVNSSQHCSRGNMSMLLCKIDNLLRNSSRVNMMKFPAIPVISLDRDSLCVRNFNPRIVITHGYDPAGWRIHGSSSGSFEIQSVVEPSHGSVKLQCRNCICDGNGSVKRPRVLCRLTGRSGSHNGQEK